MKFLFKLAAVSGLFYAAVLADRRSQQADDSRLDEADDFDGIADAEIIQADETVATPPVL